MSDPFTGAFGHVGKPSDGESVAIVLDGWPPNEIFAVVGFLMASGETPGKGDRAFLHFDYANQPAYAVVWG